MLSTRDGQSWAQTLTRWTLSELSVHNLQAVQAKTSPGAPGNVFMTLKIRRPSFCVCVLLYLFIIIANVYFNVQISAKNISYSAKIKAN